MKKRYVIILAALILLVGAIFGVTGLKSHLQTNLEQIAELSISNVDLSKIEDGVYNGGFQAFPVAAEVKVSVENHKILKIELLKHTNGKGTPAEVIIDKVVKAQTLDVDIVSGATYSSKVILKAIENALVIGQK